MDNLERAIGIILAITAVLTAGSCHHVTGPALTAQIESQQLVPTSSFDNASALCCCRVKGTIRNTSTISVNLSLRFAARNTDGQDVGTGQDFLANVPAGQERPFDAPGILEACSRVATVQADVVVVGLFQP